MRRLGTFRLSSLMLATVFVLLLAILVSNREALLEAHIDESILKVASDASIYFEVYETLYVDAELAETPSLFLVGSPILFLKLASGNLFLVELCNLALMLVALRVGLKALPSYRTRMGFLAGALVFPYFVFGFLGLNKEIYAMSSAIFFGSYLLHGRRTHLLAALVLAACARYYMLIALIVLLPSVPRSGPPRYWLMLLTLLAVSVAAPISKHFIPQYSTEGLLESSGMAGIVFSTLIDAYGYVIAYPLKYIVLLPTRAYTYLMGAGEDAMGGVVSICSMVIFCRAVAIVLARKRVRPSPEVMRLVVVGLVAPIPIMWSEIMHWRYYSFVYFFFLYAVVLHREQRGASRRVALAPQAAVRAP